MNKSIKATKRKLKPKQLDPIQVAAVVKFQREFNRPNYAEDESFSVTVLIYDEELGMYSLGYFSFANDEWKSLMDEELPKEFWWCYPPIPLLLTTNKKRTNHDEENE